MNPVRNERNQHLHESERAAVSNGMNQKQVIRYSVGFIVSVVLTMVAYLVVTQSRGVSMALIIAISILALLQLLAQLVWFLHLGEEKRPRWRTKAFVGMSFTLLIVVIGSVWIMQNLDYNMMHNHDTDSYMMKERDKGF